MTPWVNYPIFNFFLIPFSHQNLVDTPTQMVEDLSFDQSEVKVKVLGDMAINNFRCLPSAHSKFHTPSSLKFFLLLIFYKQNKITKTRK